MIMSASLTRFVPVTRPSPNSSLEAMWPHTRPCRRRRDESTDMSTRAGGISRRYAESPACTARRRRAARRRLRATLQDGRSWTVWRATCPVRAMSPAAGAARAVGRHRWKSDWRDLMRALIAGGGMAGLMTALALRESGVFTTIDVFEQTRTPSTAGAGLNIPPNAARLARWLGVDLDGGDVKGPHGAVDGGRAAILSETRMVWEDGSITRKPLDHNTSADDNAGFHHMHRLDLLMALYKRVFEFAPETGADCPIQVHMAKRLAEVSQDEESVTVTFADGTTETGDLLIGADGINSQVLEAVWPGVSTKRWTEVLVYRGLVPRGNVAAARQPDGSPLDHNPIETMSMDSRETPTAQHLTYWVRGGELLNVWLGYY